MHSVQPVCRPLQQHLHAGDADNFFSFTGDEEEADAAVTFHPCNASSVGDPHREAEQVVHRSFHLSAL